MPLATSYLEQNDYTGLKYSPYQLNVNDIAKTLAVKTAYWNQGAQKVKSRYDTALNLELTTNGNKATLKDFVLKSEQEIKDLSTQELSNPDVQEQGMKMFEPLFSDKTIMLDHAITMKKNSIYAQAETAKSNINKKTGKRGEEYADVNLMDALDGFESFNKDTPADEKTLGDLYQKVGNKSYTPYYDFTDDMKESLKNCKGAKNGNEVPDGLNTRVTETAGISAFTARACVEGGLSTQALGQIAINARVNYKNNKESLARDASAYLQNSIDGYKNGIEDIQLKKLALSKQKGSYDKDTYAQNLKSLNDKESDYSDRLNSSNTSLSKFQSNDFKELDQNYNGWAQRIYKHNLISGYADPRATYGEIHKIDSNVGAIAEYTQRNENQRLQAKFNQEDKKDARDYSQQEKLVMLKALFDDKGTMNAQQKMSLNAQYGLGVSNTLFQGLGNAEEKQGLTTAQVHEDIAKNFENGINALHDIKNSLLSIDDQGVVKSLKDLPKDNASQGDYLKVVNSAKVYLANKLALLETEKLKNPQAQLSEEDQVLRTNLNKYRDAINYNSNMTTVLNKTVSDYDKNEGAVIRQKSAEEVKGIKNFFMSANPIKTVDGKVFSNADIFDIVAGNNPNYTVKTENDKTFLIDNKTKQRSEIDNQTPVAYSNTQNMPTILKGLLGIASLGAEAKKALIGTSAKSVRELQSMLDEANKDYRAGLDLKIGQKMFETKVINGTDKSFDLSVTQKMQALNAGAKLKDKEFVTNGWDPKTGDVYFQVKKILKADKEGVTEKLANITSIDGLQSELGGNSSIALLNSYVRYDDRKKTLVMNFPELAVASEDYGDKAINLQKEHLIIEAQKTNSPAANVIFTDKRGYDIVATAVPFSTGVSFKLSYKHPTTGEMKIIPGMQNVSSDALNGKILTLKKLD